MKLAILVAVMLMGCVVTKVNTKPNTWSGEQRLALGVQCMQQHEAASLELGIRFCACVVDGMSNRFTVEWMTDGRSVTAAERQDMMRIREACEARPEPAAI